MKIEKAAEAYKIIRALEKINIDISQLKKMEFKKGKDENNFLFEFLDDNRSEVEIFQGEVPVETAEEIRKTIMEALLERKEQLKIQLEKL